MSDRMPHMSTRFTFNPFYFGDLEQSDMGSHLVTVEYRGVPAPIGSFDQEQHSGARWSVNYKGECYGLDGDKIVSEIEPLGSSRTDEFKARYRMSHWLAMHLAERLCLQVREEVLERIAKMNAREEGGAK